MTSEEKSEKWLDVFFDLVDEKQSEKQFALLLGRSSLAVMLEDDSHSKKPALQVFVGIHLNSFGLLLIESDFKVNPFPFVAEVEVGIILLSCF